MKISGQQSYIKHIREAYTVYVHVAYLSVLQTLFSESATFMQYVVFSPEWEVKFVCLEGYKWVHKTSDL